MKPILLALALFSMLGCSSRPVPPPHRTSVPVARRFEPSLLKPSARRSCAIIIVREQGVRGSGLNLYLDGDQIARITAGEKMTIYVKPGRHHLMVRPLFSPTASKRLVIEEDRPVTVRITDRDGNFQLTTADSAWLASLGRAYHSLLH